MYLYYYYIYIQLELLFVSKTVENEILEMTFLMTVDEAHSILSIQQSDVPDF